MRRTIGALAPDMMRNVVVLAAAALTVGVTSLGIGAAPAGASRAAASSGGTWGKAREVPGTAALNSRDAGLVSVSCPSAGNCGGGGFYVDRAFHRRGFVVSESNGTWGKAIEVPGFATLNQGRPAQVLSVSCGSEGNCSAGGTYAGSDGFRHAFVVSEVKGTWGKAREVPGTLNRGGEAQVLSVSCASAGNCSAGGYYGQFVFEGMVLSVEPFVVSESNGTWGKAKEVAATINSGRIAQVFSVSCASAGNCSAGGYYTDTAGNTRAFVVSEVHGTWGKARQVAGITALNQDENAQVISVSCASAGNCSAGGYYADNTYHIHQHAFVVSEVNGAWRRAIQVPGIATLDKGRSTQVISVSCASAGNCTAGGYYTDSNFHQQAFVVSEVHGTWGKAREVPGPATLNQGGNAQVNSVSCASAGNCSAGGYYEDSAHHLQAFVVSESNGAWGKAIEVPGTATLNKDGVAQVISVSCASARNCSAGGAYTDSARRFQAFVANKN